MYPKSNNYLLYLATIWLTHKCNINSYLATTQLIIFPFLSLFWLVQKITSVWSCSHYQKSRPLLKSFLMLFWQVTNQIMHHYSSPVKFSLYPQPPKGPPDRGSSFTCLLATRRRHYVQTHGNCIPMYSSKIKWCEYFYNYIGLYNYVGIQCTLSHDLLFKNTVLDKNIFRIKFASSAMHVK